VVHSFTEEEDLEVFQPTSEWQDIKPGQAIPPGLHIQINLQSGKKQAKLMDGDDGSRFKNHEKTKYFKKESHSKQKFIQINKNIFSKQHLKDALKDFKDKFHDEKPETDKTDDENTVCKYRNDKK
jgi:nucleotide exchange factor SIL1